MSDIPEFGVADAGAEHIMRAGGYALIFDATGELAVVSTPRGFMLPGGGQEAGESPGAAAVRETYEECGLRITLGARIGVADELIFAADEGVHYRKRCTFFLAEVAGSGATCEDDHELIWFRPERAALELRHESQRWAVNAATALLSSAECS